jgi:hypothetical protein
MFRLREKQASEPYQQDSVPSAELPRQGLSTEAETRLSFENQFLVFFHKLSGEWCFLRCFARAGSPVSWAMRVLFRSSEPLETWWLRRPGDGASTITNETAVVFLNYAEGGAREGASWKKNFW